MHKFIHPYNGAELLKDSDGNLYSANCDGVNLFKNHDGCYDFVKAGPELQREREHYDELYLKKKIVVLTQDGVKSEWYDEMFPWRLTLLESLGDLVNKNILLIGNGETTKELYFALTGARVILTDLSLEAVKRMKAQVELSQFDLIEQGKIEFHSIDALHLPFPDNSFEIIYGSAFVHHLDNMDQFLSEVKRCLKVNGRCRFVDGAHSSIWSFLTKTVMRPFKMYSYWRHPRSPGDLMADMRGGYTIEGLSFLMKKHGLRDMLFKRDWFFLRIVSRHYSKFVDYDQRAIARAKPLFQFMKRIDNLLAMTEFMNRNGLMLVWGFTK
jgi:ubiquinone/menaquinone biosynthesis C-methylase UbiE